MSTFILNIFNVLHVTFVEISLDLSYILPILLSIVSAVHFNDYNSLF